MTRYTLAGIARWEEEVKRSRFLAIAAPVQSSDEALTFVEAHGVPEASHNCWAYQIDSDYRFFDDGEPGGTAGKPILQAIQGQGCDRVVVLVVRWFGGTKLGTGGLVRAYGGCAAQCLRQARKVRIVLREQLRVHCPFPDMDRVRSRFDDHRIELLAEDFDERGAKWTLSVPQAGVEQFIASFQDTTKGRGDVCRSDQASV
ncbi:MAG TPA: YigZ family protein [Burkholderiaceae bacterium]|nr:YigZ family protein [Burkholderiaceae bacterium]